MALYTASSIERLKDAIDVVELVSARTDLRRVGSRWVGLCPFHEERTPSFTLSPEKGFYHCFGCGASGDAITFVRETEALDFREAVELLAERFRVELEVDREDPGAERRRRLFTLLERTARFYATYLWESAEAAKARRYLVERGLGEEVLREFWVGYSPSAWDRVLVGAQRDGFTQEQLLEVGLAQQGRGGGVYDRFRGRIMFPLANASGRVLGFGARAMGEGRGPKYLNTSENEIYKKGRQLFGLHLAREPAREAGRIVVVEGYTDVLALHQAGIREAVAIMGTALTDEQLDALSWSSKVYLALDADRAGRGAMLRAARSAAERDLELLVVDMPEGSDPAELVARHGVDAFRDRIERGLPVSRFEVHRILADADVRTPAGRDRALQEAVQVIAATPTRSMRDELVRVVSDRVDIPAAHVSAEVERRRAPGARPRPEAPPAADSFPAASLAAEREFLAMCARSGEVGRRYLERLQERHLSFETTRRAWGHLLRHFDDPLVDLPEEDRHTSTWVLSVLAGDEGPAAEPSLRLSFLSLELRRIERELKRAGAEGDLRIQIELAKEKQRVGQEMAAVMGQAT